MNIFQINGKRGFANRRHLQETRVYQRNEQVLYAAPPEAQYYEAQLGGPGKGVKKNVMPNVKTLSKHWNAFYYSNTLCCKCLGSFAFL